MEEAVLKLIVTVPAAAAVIVTAWLFLRAQRELNSQWQETVRSIANQAHQDRTETKKVVVDNTRAMTMVAERLANVTCIPPEERDH